MLGIIAAVICYIFCSAVKNALGYDDALDVFGVHRIGGITGAILTGIWSILARRHRHHELRNRQDRRLRPVAQLISQCKAVGMTLLWSGIGTLVILKVIDVIIGLRLTPMPSAKASISTITASALQHVTDTPRGGRAASPTRLGWRPGTALSSRPRLTPRPLYLALRCWRLSPVAA